MTAASCPDSLVAAVIDPVDPAEAGPEPSARRAERPESWTWESEAMEPGAVHVAAAGCWPAPAKRTS
jgi:hypothetical protein